MYFNCSYVVLAPSSIVIIPVYVEAFKHQYSCFSEATTFRYLDNFTIPVFVIIIVSSSYLNLCAAYKSIFFPGTPGFMIRKSWICINLSQPSPLSEPTLTNSPQTPSQPSGQGKEWNIWNIFGWNAMQWNLINHHRYKTNSCINWWKPENSSPDIEDCDAPVDELKLWMAPKI